MRFVRCVNSGSGKTRGAIAGFGAGAGAGSSWTTCQLAFAGDSNAQEKLDKADKVIDEIKDKLSN